MINKLNFNSNERKMDNITDTSQLDSNLPRSKPNTDKRHYVSKWASSSDRSDNGNSLGDDEAINESNLLPKSDSLTEEDFLLTGEIRYVDDLPDFADEKCRLLHQQIKQMEKDRDEASKSAKEHVDRVIIMKDHLKNVNQEIEHTNAMVAAKKKQLLTEKHLKALAEREYAVALSEMKRVDEDINAAQATLKRLSHEIAIANEEKEKLKLSLNWTQEELEQWATVAAKKEDDNLALERYTRADELKIKELTLEIEKLSKLSIEQQAAFQSEVTETKAKRLELDKAANSLKRHHEERQQILKQWQETINAMKSRDEEITKISGKYADTMERNDRQLQAVASSRQELAIIESEIGELQNEIEALDRIVQNKRQDRLTMQQSKQDLEDELNILKVESIASSSELHDSRSRLIALQGQLKDKKEEMARYREACDEIKRNLESENQVAVSHEKTSQMIEETLKNREKELKRVTNHVKSLKDKLFKDSQHLNDLRQSESNLIADIRGSQSNSKVLSSKIKQLESELSKQSDILYNTNYQVEQMEQKVARGLGARSDDEKILLLERISSLEKDLNFAREQSKYIHQQSKTLNQEVQKWRRKFEHHEKMKCEMKDAITEEELEISSLEQNLKQLMLKKEQFMVSHDMIGLDVKRLRDILRNKIDQVYSLENREKELVETMSRVIEEKKIEIEVKSAQLRAAEEERHRCVVQLGQRSLIAEKLQSKYEILTKALHPDGESDDGGHSPVLYLIEAAQKKANLQRQGDQLDSDIRQKEKELKAMEDALTRLKDRNTNFRKSFAKADKSGKEIQDVEILTKKLESSERELMEAKKELIILQRQFEKKSLLFHDNEVKLRNLHDDNVIMERSRNESNESLQELKKKVAELENEVEKKRIVLRQKENLSTLSQNVKSLYEQSIEADVMNKHAGHLIRMLRELGRELPELEDLITEDMLMEGIEV